MSIATALEIARANREIERHRLEEQARRLDELERRMDRVERRQERERTTDEPIATDLGDDTERYLSSLPRH